MNKSKRIGIFAGTFDPVHDGHVAFAMAALKAAHLDSVYFLPEPEPRKKTDVTALPDRVAMLCLALAGNPQLDVFELPDKQFTVHKTLPKLQAAFPGAKLVFLFGSDVAHHLQAWPGADNLQNNAELVVAVRHGDQTPRGLVATLVPTPHTHVAASHVRNGTSDAVAPAVRAYMDRHGLYTL